MKVLVTELMFELKELVSNATTPEEVAEIQDILHSCVKDVCDEKREQLK